jgi:acetyl esterase/lipase
MRRFRARVLVIAALTFTTLTAISLVTPTDLAAQPADDEGAPVVVPLWEGRAPGALGDGPADRPVLTVYRPLVAPGADAGRGHAATAVIIAPGGGYSALAHNHEGRQMANWWNAHGVTAFVLTYRLAPRYRHPVPLADLQRAIRLVRARAASYGVGAERVGVMGFSAGGHLAATAGTRFDAGDPQAADPIDRVGSRPDFLVLGYAMISLAEPYREPVSAGNLVARLTPELMGELSADRHVTARTPPTFLFHTGADPHVPPENSVLFYLALRKAGVPAELHIMERGLHGVGLGLYDPTLGAWPTLLAAWMREHGWSTPRA